MLRKQSYTKKESQQGKVDHHVNLDHVDKAGIAPDIQKSGPGIAANSRHTHTHSYN